MTAVSAAFWRDRRVLLTGHTGFKGGWLAIWLERMGAKVTGIALPPDHSSPSLFAAAGVGHLVARSVMLDIRDADALATMVREVQPEIVLHLAAQPLVRLSYAQPIETFATNVMGTAHLLNGLRTIDSVRVIVCVTTDKVYANKEWAWPYREDDALGGYDPYSASKSASEMIINSYRSSFFDNRRVRIASARAGNVIGGGDWSADRLIPDAVRAWERGEALTIRRPDAVRPWQHVLEPLRAYLVLAQRLWDNSTDATAYNFGPDPVEAVSVRHVIDIAAQAWGGRARIEMCNFVEGPAEADCLALETARARIALGIKPRWPLRQGIVRSVAWYRRQLAGESALELCCADIDAYETAP